MALRTLGLSADDPSVNGLATSLTSASSTARTSLLASESSCATAATITSIASERSDESVITVALNRSQQTDDHKLPLAPYQVIVNSEDSRTDSKRYQPTLFRNPPVDDQANHPMKNCAGTFLGLMGVGTFAVCGGGVSETYFNGSKNGYWIGALVAIVMLACYYRYCLRGSNANDEQRMSPQPR